ncbi:MAG: hypothetical protein DMF74_15385 [Acidobacteria bacterium]|nr:MAG: hypothetical protein DMF74_15385 [Acidobacteriota bacterium]
MVAVLNSLIELDERGVAWIVGANTKVKEVVLDKMAYGWSPEEMHFQHPHLSMAQVHAALAYYYEHQVEIDAQIMSDWQEVNELAAQQPESPLRQRLRQIKRERERSLVL